jgi:hypothetical protein
MKILSCVFFAAALAAANAGSAFASPLGTMTCTPASTSVTTSLSFNVSYYDVSSAAVVASQSTGAGAGKVVFNPLTIDTALSNFQEFFAAAQAGETFSECVLNVRAANGTIVTYDFRTLSLSTVQAIAGSSAADGSRSSAYTEVLFQYGGLQVTTSRAVDDGGFRRSH